MSAFNTLLSAGAVLASASATPGAIVLDGSSADFSVASCTAGTVVITGAAANSLEPGHILAYTESNDEAFADDNVCAGCSPLFRKIISRDGDTFTTSFATFAEIFPDGMYDPSLSEVLVEPQLNCEHSRFDRQLEESEPVICESLKDWELYSIFLITAFSPTACCLIPFLGIANLIALGSCPDWTVGLDFESLVGGGDGRKLSEYYINEALKHFPNSSDEWMATDSDGHCMYANCEVESNGAQCFNEGSDSSVCKDIGHGMFGLAMPADHDFSEACSVQNYCYSSRFGKTICDGNFYKSMRNTCGSQAGSVAVPTTFPLTSSALSNNCHMSSILFYLGAKLFGKSSYDYSQLEQHKYCGSASTVQI